MDTNSPTAPDGSPRFSLDLKDAQSLLIGAGIATAGATGTFLLQYIEAIDQSGLSGVIACAILSIVANLLRKLYTDNTKQS